MIILRPLLLLTNLHLKLLSTQGTGADKLLSTQRVKLSKYCVIDARLSLCKNNATSKILTKLQIFHFRCTVHTNTTPTVITHSCVLQKPPSCNNNGYKFEFRFVDQIGTSVDKHCCSYMLMIN